MLNTEYKLISPNYLEQKIVIEKVIKQLIANSNDEFLKLELNGMCE